MRLTMMMRDTEYRDALIGMIADLDKDVLIEIAGTGSVRRDSVILTDILPSEIEKRSLDRIKGRTVFLTQVNAGKADPECSILFKYSSLQAIMAELALVWSEWSGDCGTITASSRVIAVTGESDQLSSLRCRTLAGQIAYRHGGSILIIPLGYINDYRIGSDTEDSAWFRKLMYFIDEGRDYMPESFTHTDSYGISCLRLPGGINPLTALGQSHLSGLIQSMSRHYDTLILDIGTCFSEMNLNILNNADNIIFFGCGRRIENPAEFIGNIRPEKLVNISGTDAGEEARGIDDFISETYGRTDQKKNDS